MLGFDFGFMNLLPQDILKKDADDIVGVVVSHITDSVTQVQGKWQTVARVHDMLERILTTYKHYSMEELCNLLTTQEDQKLPIQQLGNEVR